MKSKIIFLILLIGFSQASAVEQLNRGECLTANQQLTSNSGCFNFIFQSDGNAVIYRVGTNNALTAVFSTQSNGKGADRICMQTDGNLVVYGGSTPFFNTGTSGTAGSFVVLQDDGNLVIYNSDRSQHFWASNTAQSGVTCSAQSDAATTTSSQVYVTNSRPGCDITKFLFDNDGNFLKLACWVKGPRDQEAAVEYCSNIGMRLFVPSSAADVSAITSSTIDIFGKTGYTSVWISGIKRSDTQWRDSNSGGKELFTSFAPAIVEYNDYNPITKCLSLSSFGVDGYQLITYNCYTAQSFWCEF